MGRFLAVVAGLAVAAGLSAGLLVTSAPARAAPPAVTFPTLGFVEVARDIPRPVAVTHAGDGSNRLFLTEQAGRIHILTSGGTRLPTPFLDIDPRVVSGDERGLLSVAFPPNYAANGWFYVNYTGEPRTAQGFTIVTGDTVISRFRRSAGDPNLADPTSEQILLVIRQPHANHNGGQLQFSPRDGYLYIGMGDGGSGGDPDNYSLRRHDRMPANQGAGPCPTCIYLGKMLRIDVETPALQGRPGFDVPVTNPIIGGVRDAIWAYGLRNPWRFSFDRVTGDLFIADVGQNTREEISWAPASSPGGENYQWSCREGNLSFSAGRCAGLVVGPGQPPAGTPPIFDYPRDFGGSVTGGYVYRGAAHPSLRGIYLFADLGGHVWGLASDGCVWQSRILRTPSSSTPPHTFITTFGEDEAGEVYIVGNPTFNGSLGRLFRITATGVAPAATPTPAATGTPGGAPSMTCLRHPGAFKASAASGW